MTAAFDVRIPPVLAFGPGVVKRVGAEAKALRAFRALLVTDENMVTYGYASMVELLLKDEGIESTVFAGVTSEPTLEHVRKGARLLREANCDLVVGLGGGSPIDAAKAIGVVATNDDFFATYKDANRSWAAKVPVIALPTTSGTGADVSRYVIITDAATNVKMLVQSPLSVPQIFLGPEVSLVDPSFTGSCPKWLTAGAGIDALCHAVEAYISKRASPMSDALALSAISLIFSSLRQAWNDGDDLEARSKMSVGSLQAAMAFNISSVALVHGMARPLGAQFHIHHGTVNAMLMPYVLPYDVPSASERFADIANAMGEDIRGLDPLAAGSRAVNLVTELCRHLQLPTLSALGVTREALLQVIPQMVRDAFESGSPANNPREASAEDIMRLYEQAL